MDDLKMKPYDRLQAILSEKNSGKLTPNAKSNLDLLFGEKKEPTFWNKISDLFRKIDSFVFKPRSRKYNTMYSRRKK
jgi:hypothetical protein